jgi:hypothetical protein
MSKDDFVKGLRSVAEEAMEEVTKRSQTPAADRVKRIADKRGDRPRRKAEIRLQKAMNSANRQDALRPVKKMLGDKGKSWMWFIDNRLRLDPNLGKMKPKQRQRRVAELWNELGEEGFAKRFNL